MAQAVAVAAHSRGRAPTGRTGHFRWVICALLFFATTINYIDRQVLGILAPDAAEEHRLDRDRVRLHRVRVPGRLRIGLLLVRAAHGPRSGPSSATPSRSSFWSLPRWPTPSARTPFGFGAARFALGLGEAGNFPAAIKTVAEWFPKKERALATGIFNAGTNVGAIVAPLVVPWIALTYGWQWAFIVTGALGFVWLGLLVAALRAARERIRACRAAELAYIRSDPAEPPAHVPWLTPAAATARPGRSRIGKFLTDPIWWFYLYLAPRVPARARTASTSRTSGLPLDRDLPDRRRRQHRRRLAVVAPDQAGLERQRARARPPCSSARCASCRSSFAAERRRASGSPSLLIGLAAAAHQGWSANIFTIASDMFPRRAVGSVVGHRRHGGRHRRHADRHRRRLHPRSSRAATSPLFVLAGCASTWWRSS